MAQWSSAKIDVEAAVEQVWEMLCEFVCGWSGRRR